MVWSWLEESKLEGGRGEQRRKGEAQPHSCSPAHLPTCPPTREAELTREHPTRAPQATQRLAWPPI